MKPGSLVWLLLSALCSSGSAIAQAECRFVPSAVREIVVIRPGSAEYEQKIAEYLPEPSKRETVRQWLDCSMILKNEGERPIALVVSRFEYSLDGRAVAGVVRQRAEAGRELAPGQMLLVTPAGFMTNAIRTDAPIEWLVEFAAQGPQNAFRRSPYIDVSVDAVYYLDGSFAGPDRSGVWQDLVVEREATGALRSELEGLGAAVDLISARLEELSDAVRPPTLPGRVRADMARYLQAALRQSYGTYREALRDIYGTERYPELRRLQ